MKTFNTNDTYRVSHKDKNQKQNIDYKVLTRLYTPIIGCNATGLYLVLESELSLNKGKKDKPTILRLIQLSGLSKLDSFNNELKKLEDNNLVVIQGNKEDGKDFRFILNPCRKATDLLNDEKFKNKLITLTGEKYVKQVENYFLDDDNDDDDQYQDIRDVILNSEPKDEEIFDVLYQKYPVASQSWVIDNKTKQEVLRLKKLFKLKYDEIENAMLNTFVTDGDVTKIDLDKLNDFISSKYQEKKPIDVVSLFEKERSLNYYEKLAGHLLPRERDMILELLDTYRISEGILNTIINYYYQYAPNKSGNPKNYFIKIIEGMQLQNVKTTEDAINYFKENNARRQKYLQNENELPKDEIVDNKKEVKENNEDVEELLKLLGDL